MATVQNIANHPVDLTPGYTLEPRQIRAGVNVAYRHEQDLISNGVLLVLDPYTAPAAPDYKQVLMYAKFPEPGAPGQFVADLTEAAEGEVIGVDGQPTVGGGGGGAGVTVYNLLADLPPAPSGNPVALVKEDFTLYGWSDTEGEWLPLGSGGGPDFITVPFDPTGLDPGEALVWDSGDARFEPGALT